MKRCGKCHQSKDESLFMKNKSTKTGLDCYCKECRRLLSAIERKTNKYKKLKRIYYRTANGRYRVYKANAKRKKIKFKITFEQFDKLTKLVCDYCGQHSPKRPYCGLDRVDCDKGYTLNNVVPCCSLCNSMKSNMPRYDFWQQVQQIAENYRRKYE